MTKMSHAEEDLFKVTTRILCDVRPSHGLDAICLVTETGENEAASIETAAEAWKLGAAGSIAISGYVGAHTREFTVPGYESVKKRLIEHGVAADAIYVFPLAADLPPSTDAEARGCIAYAAEKGWKYIGIVAPPLHQVRTVISVVSACVKAQAPIQVYSMPAPAPSWVTSVIHSESDPRAKRIDHLSIELAKIKRYETIGLHISYKELLSYFDRRDQEGEAWVLRD